MSQRIFNACKRHFSQREYTKEEINRVIDNLANDSALVDKIRTEANLEIALESVAKDFCLAKVPHAFQYL